MLRRVLFIFVAVLCLLSPIVTLAQALDTNKTISLDVSNANLHAVARLLEHQTGITALVRDGKTPFHNVYVHLDGASLPKVLQTIAQSAGAKAYKNEDGVYVFEPLNAVDPMPSDSVPIEKPKLRVPLHREDLNWHTLALQHTRAADILKLMRWDKPSGFPFSFQDFKSPSQVFHPGVTITPFPRNDYPAKPFPLHGDIPVNPNLPEGVGRIFAMSHDNTLLVEATNEGFQSVKQIVKILDIAAREMVAKVSYIGVSPEQSGIKLSDSQSAQGIFEIISGPEAAQSFDRLVKSGHMPNQVNMLHEFEGNEPMEWLVPGYRLTRPRINSDASFTLWIESRKHFFPAKETPPIFRSDVLAIHEIEKADVILIKIEYGP